MSIAGIGAGNQTHSAEYTERKDVVIKTYAYKDGKGQEITYNLKDCLQLSLDSYEIPIGSDTYEELKNKMKLQTSGYMSLPNNKLFYETYDVMTDFYDGKLGRDEVKNIFRNISIIRAANPLLRINWQIYMSISAGRIHAAPVFKMKKREKNYWKARDLAGAVLIIIMRTGIGHVRICRSYSGRLQMSLQMNTV